MSASIPERLLLGPGPSPVSARVLQALTSPVLGHLDPAFLQVMDETMDLLRQVFRTRNDLTIPISGTGSAGMEAAIVNLVEPGDPAPDTSESAWPRWRTGRAPRLCRSGRHVRAPTLTIVVVPEGIDDLAVRRRLLQEQGIEIAGGLGPLRGTVLRIGLMGEGPENARTFLAAFEAVLNAEGFPRGWSPGRLAPG